uniref:Pancreatic triacylglycerol lipase n=1 Tax=Lepeophtheirus salmonis TaxID=72036 RepID=C1BTH8_LEPSM|nr:Pancreatic triacylglycerol lipase precursor [Lepeophtheirus salmonis]
MFYSNLILTFISAKMLAPNFYIVEGKSTKCKQNLDQDTIKFLIWNRHNMIYPEILKYNQDRSKLFNQYLPTKFLVHGYRDVGDTNWIQKAKIEYLRRENCNVISIDWSVISFQNYISAIWHLKEVASVSRDFLSNLKNSRIPGHQNLTALHPIGFSLGAHIVGILGKMFKSQLPRITGLDPARPIVEILPSSWKLDKKSAQFVDVIHGAGHYLTMTGMVGNVDFFPNGGVSPQPGCEREPLNLVCSHLRVADLYVESINSPIGFKSRLCNSWRLFETRQCNRNPTSWMGYRVDKHIEGKFFLFTRSYSPFAIPL